MKWSGNDSYSTPDYLRKCLDMEFGFTLDPCPLEPDWHPLRSQDGLLLDWDDQRVFCNPPWSDITPWVQKSYASKALTVFVLPARTDTKWFHILTASNAELRYFRKRVQFIREGVAANPTDGTLIAVVRNMNFVARREEGTKWKVG